MNVQKRKALKFLALFGICAVFLSLIMDLDELRGEKKYVKLRRKVDRDKNMPTSKSDDRSLLSESNVEKNIHSEGYVVKLYDLITNEKCDNIIGSIKQNDPETWQKVDINRNMYVFSAYYVAIRRSVFIIGTKPRSKVMVVICQFWMEVDGEKLVLIEQATGQISAPEDVHGRKYTSTIFQCQVNTANIPTHVSLVTNTCQTPLNLLVVHNASRNSGYARRFTVCLAPLHFRHGRAYALVEWIELNRMLGAEYFVVYNYSSAENVQQVLEYYASKKIAEVIQWRLPMGVKTFPKTKEPDELWYFGQTAALSDCLFRNKQVSEFVVNIDLDEFIIPHSNNISDWFGIVNELKKGTTAYVFRSTFFRKDWERREKINFTNHELANRLRLVTLQVFEHEAKIFPSTHRTKYIARTKDVHLMLTHEVPGVNSLTVPVDIAIVHHYRDWAKPGDKIERVVDKTVLKKFDDILIENTQNVWRDLKNVMMDVPVK